MLFTPPNATTDRSCIRPAIKKSPGRYAPQKSEREPLQTRGCFVSSSNRPAQKRFVHSSLSLSLFFQLLLQLLHPIAASNSLEDAPQLVVEAGVERFVLPVRFAVQLVQLAALVL